MHPVLATFSVGGTKVVLPAYGTFYTLAWVVAVALATVIAWRRGFSWWRALLTFAIGLAVGIAGSRLFDLVVNWGAYAQHPGTIYAFKFTGFALDGGLILAVVASAVLARHFRLPLWRLADGTVPAVAAGIVLMRIGCLLNGCCFGTVTSLPWGVTYPAGSQAWAWEVATGRSGLLGFAGLVKPVHPTQVYEMIAAVVLCGLTVWLLRRGRPLGPTQIASGVPFLVFALGFTLFRLGNYFLRVHLPGASMPPWFYPSLYAVISVVVGAMLAWRVSLSRRINATDEGPGTADVR
jgi:phosphatidylglycerol---prolipoprotein diacylglyceryl transferase